MNDTQIQTGNSFADAMIERRLSMAPEYWALISYLEKKGVLDREEFAEFFTKSMTTFVQAVTQAHKNQDI